VVYITLGRKAKTGGTIIGRDRSTRPFIAPRSAGPTPGTLYTGSRNVKKCAVIVRAAPINRQQSGSDTGGYGDLGPQNLGASQLSDPVSPTTRTFSQSQPAAMLTFNLDPAAGAPTAAPHPSSILSFSSKATTPSVNGTDGVTSHLDVYCRSSLV